MVNLLMYHDHDGPTYIHVCDLCVHILPPGCPEFPLLPMRTYFPLPLISKPPTARTSTQNAYFKLVVRLPLNINIDEISLNMEPAT